MSCDVLSVLYSVDLVVLLVTRVVIDFSSGVLGLISVRDLNLPQLGHDGFELYVVLLCVDVNEVSHGGDVLLELVQLHESPRLVPFDGFLQYSEQQNGVSVVDDVVDERVVGLAPLGLHGFDVFGVFVDGGVVGRCFVLSDGDLVFELVLLLLEFVALGALGLPGLFGGSFDGFEQGFLCFPGGIEVLQSFSRGVFEVLQ